MKPDFESQIILSKILKKNRSYLISHRDEKINYLKYLKAIKNCKKRVKNIPLAYINKEKGFYNINLTINKNVLIPRPESELFIDYFKNKNFNNSLTIDIGTGSGVLIISLLKNINLKKFYNYKFIASDISVKAIKLAKKNAKKYNLKNIITFKKSDLLSSFKKNELLTPNNIYIIANLPYLNKKEMEEISIQKEPKKALYSNKNGLDHYYRLIDELKQFKLNTKKIEIAMEINPHQKNLLIKKIRDIFPNFDHNIIKDYNNKDRILVIKNYK